MLKTDIVIDIKQHAQTNIIFARLNSINSISIRQNIKPQQTLVNRRQQTLLRCRILMDSTKHCSCLHVQLVPLYRHLVNFF